MGACVSSWAGHACARPRARWLAEGAFGGLPGSVGVAGLPPAVHPSARGAAAVGAAGGTAGEHEVGGVHRRIDRHLAVGVAIHHRALRVHRLPSLLGAVTGLHAQHGAGQASRQVRLPTPHGEVALLEHLLELDHLVRLHEVVHRGFVAGGGRGLGRSLGLVVVGGHAKGGGVIGGLPQRRCHRGGLLLLLRLLLQHLQLALLLQLAEGLLLDGLLQDVVQGARLLRRAADDIRQMRGRGREVVRVLLLLLLLRRHALAQGHLALAPRGPRVLHHKARRLLRHLEVHVGARLPLHRPPVAHPHVLVLQGGARLHKDAGAPQVALAPRHLRRLYDVPAAHEGGRARDNEVLAEGHLLVHAELHRHQASAVAVDAPAVHGRGAHHRRAPRGGPGDGCCVAGYEGCGF
mmetsp:Transcript_10532/g.38751  ORF Transcript_10532/g.38751 Transcript_10532/m.38751 type:complete len:405 (+) Transcript_10532:563-1777(+)